MLAEIFGVDSVMIVLLFLVTIGIVLWAVVDVARRPTVSPGAKAGWIIGMVLGTFLFGIVGLVVAIVYLAAVRPRLSGG